MIGMYLGVVEQKRTSFAGGLFNVEEPVVVLFDVRGGPENAVVPDASGLVLFLEDQLDLLGRALVLLQDFYIVVGELETLLLPFLAAIAAHPNVNRRVEQHDEHSPIIQNDHFDLLSALVHFIFLLIQNQLAHQKLGLLHFERSHDEHLYVLSPIRRLLIFTIFSVL